MLLMGWAKKCGTTTWVEKQKHNPDNNYATSKPMTE
jgi:hypothetical protein